MKRVQGRTAVLLASAASVALVAGAATAQTVKMGIPTFLTGASFRLPTTASALPGARSSR